MLRTILVDDDEIVRTNLKSMINWEEYGFVIADEAANGVECIQKMSLGHYDLVITDMSMPIMGGVALIDSIRQYYPEVEIIAISGYEDFNYVHDSLKKGVVDYVLKHKLDKITLYEVLNAVKTKIIEHNKLIYKDNLHLEQLSEGRTLLLRNMVQDIVSGRISFEETKHHLEALDVSCKFINTALCYMEIQNFSVLEQDNGTRAIRAFIDIVEKIITEECTGFVVHFEENCFVSFIDFGEIHSTLLIYQMLAGILHRICSTSKRYMGFNLVISVSDICNSFERIPSYFLKVKKSLENKFYDNEQIIWSHNNAPKEESQLSLSLRDEESIGYYLEEGNKEGILEFLNGIFNKCIAGNVSVRTVQVICAELISIAIQFCIKHELLSERDKLVEFQLSGEHARKKFVELCEFIKQIYANIISEYTTFLDISGGNSYIIKAMQYIYSNYRNDISLTDTADYVGVSSQYLSKLINEECKKSFAELLNGKRVKAACEIISERTYKIKEVAGRVGFNNYNYFFKVFKEIMGVTPVEYEKKYFISNI